jgi:NAD(P)-dependent dehydrogenase (short-subunit alcohol dehydrogenase family)
MKIIVTGSEGLIGKAVKGYLDYLGHETIGLDAKTSFFDANSEPDVISYMKKEADALINCFALNHHIPEYKITRPELVESQKKKAESVKLMGISLDSFEDYLKTNVTALFSVCREFKRNNPKGSIVNFSSTYGIGSPRPDMYGDGEKHIAYGVSKAAVIQLTKHLATHWAPDMRVNCIVPGGIENGQSQEFIDAYSKHTPMGRMAKVEEICGLVEFLISDKASYCTGGVYPVDGGWTAW